MKSDHWTQVQTIFDAVVKLPPAQRVAYLGRYKASGDVLREVQSLLDANGRAQAFLDVPAAFSPPVETRRGDGRRVGRFHLLRPIGAGGTSTVYLARPVDGPADDAVAVKIIGAGMDAHRVMRAFRTERRTLERLDHSHIARLLGGGTTDDGRPYLAVEYVPGRPLDAYCRQERLSVASRLRLFCRICEAVQYAHRHLVVHRDLKPSNILVTDDGEPKLLDFGIAKVLDDGDRGASATRTATAARVLTPDYASPEQFLGEPVTTASDIYSLGVVLFELLTGRRPYDTRELTLRDVERVVCEDDPDRPSDVARHLADDAAAAFSTTPDRLRRALAGDLDTIVLTALRKEPHRRYASAEQLAADVSRFVEGLPIQARKDSFTYRAGKYARRHWRLVAVAQLIVVLTITAIMAIAWQGHTARIERDRAQTEAATARRVTEFLVELFEASDPLVSPAGTPTMREILDRGARRLETDLHEEPPTRSALLNAVAGIYRNLGDYAQAERLFEQTLAIRHEHFGPDSFEYSQTLNDLGTLYRQMSDYDRSIELLERAIEIRRRFDRDTALAVSLANLGLARFESGDRQGSIDPLDEARALIETGDIDYPWLYTSVLSAQATLLSTQGRLEEAGELFERVLEIRIETHGRDTARVAISLNNLAYNLDARGRYQEAMEAYEESLAIRRAHYGDEHPSIARALANLGMELTRLGRMDEAIEHLEQALAIRRRTLPEGHGGIATSRCQLGYALLQADRLDEAEPHLAGALDRWSTLFQGDHRLLVKARLYLGAALVRQGRLDEARPMIDEAAAMAQRMHDGDHPDLVHLLELEAEAAGASGAWHEAERLLRESWEMARRVLGETHPITARIRSELGWALHHLERPPEAEHALRGALAVQIDALPDGHPQTTRTHDRIAALGRH